MVNAVRPSGRLPHVVDIRSRDGRDPHRHVLPQDDQKARLLRHPGRPGEGRPLPKANVRLTALFP